jgi:hypothetical protein
VPDGWHYRAICWFTPSALAQIGSRVCRSRTLRRISRVFSSGWEATQKLRRLRR